MVHSSGPERRTVLFSGHNFGFLKPFISYCQVSPKYKVLIEEHPSHEIVDREACASLLKQADIVFCEWCLDNAVWFSHHKRPHQKLLVRLHSQELRLPYLDKVEWKNVDTLIAICPLHLQAVLDRHPELKEKSVLIYNPIDCDALSVPKLFGAEFNLGLLGMCPRLKAPHLALEIFETLRKIDRRFTLYIKGKTPSDYPWLWERPEERDYYHRLYAALGNASYANSVVFEPFDSEVSEWFSKIGFILSTSEREGSHQAVAEGMASGALPIIRNWQGAELLYPERFVFKTVPEAVELILRLKTLQNYRREFLAVKDYARSRFDQKTIAEQYDKLISGLYAEPIELANRGNGSQPSASGTKLENIATNRKKLVAMHVCYLTPGKQNGYAIRVMEETRALTRQGVEVVIACCVPQAQSAPEDYGNFQRYLEENTGSKCRLIPTKQFFSPSVFSAREDALSNSLASLARAHGADLLHGQALYSTMHALRARRNLAAKVVFDVHGISPEEAELGGANPMRTKTMEDWERRALEEADLRVFVSAGMRTHFQQKYGLHGRPNCLVPCCVRRENFAMEEEARLRKRQELRLENRFVFLYLGTLSVWQWPEALFSVFSQFHEKRPDSLLYLLLPQSDHEVALSYCRKHKLAPDSFLLAEVPHERVGTVAGIADAGLLLRKAHPVNAVSSPTKFGEYLAAGLPTVATDTIGDTSDIIRSERVGLVVSAADEGLAPSELESLLCFAEDVRANRSDWSSRAIQAAERHLGWTTSVHTLVDSYRAMVEAPVPGL